MRAVKIILGAAWAVAVAFVLFVALYMFNEAMSDTQYYATSLGMSLRECTAAAERLGGDHHTAQQVCHKRVPKK